ncbi:MAG: EAL domain-containing protein [Pseudomonadota bacterium]|nr:EAL domain-containing protein [Pseudomonadota bacterium]
MIQKPPSPLRSPDTSSFAVVGIFAAIVLCLLIVADVGFGLLSSVRAYVGGESVWSKAQKDAVLHLQNYARDHSAEELNAFRLEIAIPLADRDARVEMDKQNPDFKKVQRSLMRGGNHVDDIGGMFHLYRRFASVGFMQRAIRTWRAADTGIERLDENGKLLQHEIESVSPRAERIRVILAEIALVNQDLGPVEKQFVAVLSEASRTAYRWVENILLGATSILLSVGTLLSVRIVQHRRRAAAHINYLAFHDSLTGLPNRLMLNDHLERALGRHRRADTPMAVLFVDLDRFKAVNDSLGYEIGDLLLHQVADRLRANSREGDIVARIGDDKFVVLIDNHSPDSDITGCAERLVERLSAPYMLGTKDCHITVSIGISVFPSDGNDSQALLKAADLAMYRAKQAGRNSFLFYSAAMNEQTVARLELESDLSHALQRGEFLLHYQPKVEAATGRITGLEALLRWKHPRRGLVPPLDFIPLAEETGLIIPIGEWVLATACARTKAWQEKGLPGLRIAVNLSARQFADPSLLKRLTGIIQASGLAPSSLELEITESAVMAHGERAATVIGKLKSIGVQIAIDDFGTGYSSLAYLKCFPINTIKIDRSFISDIPSDSGDKKITRAIIAMAHSLKLNVVAEGVETAEQLAFLRLQRCDEIQGYFLYHPIPEIAVEEVLELNRLQCDAHLAVGT